MNTTCPMCERQAIAFDVCADCKRTGCERCLSFADMPGYPLCENCALARDEERNTPPKPDTHTASAETGSKEGNRWQAS